MDLARSFEVGRDAGLVRLVVPPLNQGLPDPEPMVIRMDSQ